MTKIIYLLIGIFLLQSCEKKELTENEILEIIHSQEEYKGLELKTDFFTGYEFIDSIKTFREIIIRENFKSIYKTDFNNDGKEDYLVNLTYPKTNDNSLIKVFINEDNFQTAILLSNTKGYQLLNPGKSQIYGIISSKIIHIKNQPLIKLTNYNRRFDNSNNLIKFDTLMIKNNQLTEYTKFSKNHHIEKIIFTQIGGYAPGIKYQLTLTKDSITLQSKFYKNLKGKYIGINNSNFKILSKYLNEINFNSLSNHYSTICNDCSSIETEIIFENGKSRKVYDYDEKGTLGLLRFYDIVKDIVDKEKWKNIGN